MNRRPAAAVVALVALVASCGRSPSDRIASADTAAAAVASDSLALSAGDVEIWFTHLRPGRTPDGAPCADRAIEIRRGAIRTPVPLLYTGETPRIVNESTARAILYTDCRAGDAYLVDLRNGRPTRERR